MLTIQQIVKKLQDRRIDKIAEATGLHYHTVRAIRAGENTDPAFSTAKALSDYLEAQEAE